MKVSLKAFVVRGVPSTVSSQLTETSKLPSPGPPTEGSIHPTARSSASPSRSKSDLESREAPESNDRSHDIQPGFQRWPDGAERFPYQS